MKTKTVLRLHIGSVQWRVVLEDRLTLDGDLCNGLCDFNRCTISISTHLRRSQRLETLIHEVMHPWLHACGSHPRTVEEQCRFTGKIMGQLLYDLMKQREGLETLLSG